VPLQKGGALCEVDINAKCVCHMLALLMLLQRHALLAQRKLQCLAHLVCARALCLPVHVVCVQLVVDGDVEVAVVLLARLVLEETGDGLAFLDGQDVLKVEDGLLPVRVLCVRAGGKLDGLVAAGEFDVEPGDQGMDEVVATNLELVRQLEGEVRDSARVEIECDDGGGVGDNGLDVDGVDERLGQSGVLEGGVVEAPDVVPD